MGREYTVLVNAPLMIGHELLQHTFLYKAIERLQRSLDVINGINPMMILKLGQPSFVHHA